MYSLESAHRGDFNEYTQHTIILWKIEKISLNYRYLLPDLASYLTLSSSNYPYLEQSSMVPKMFEPLKFVCILFCFSLVCNVCPILCCRFTLPRGDIRKLCSVIVSLPDIYFIILFCFSLGCNVCPILCSWFTLPRGDIRRLCSVIVSLPDIYFIILFCFSLVCNVCPILCCRFTLPLGDIRRLCSVIVSLPGHLLNYFDLLFNGL